MIPARSASATQSAPPRPSRAIANGRWARSARRAPAPSNTPSTRNAGAATSRVRDMGAVKAKKATEGRKGGRGICFTHARAKRFDPGAPARSARLRGRAQARGARVPRRAGAALRARAPRAAGAPPRAPAGDRRRPVAGLPARDAPYQRPRLDGRADPPRPARPPRRDHRPGRAQDDDQRAQLGRQRVHGGLRGRERAHVGEQRARPAEPARRSGRHDRVHERRGKALRPGAAHRDAGGAAAGMAPRRKAYARSAALFDFGLAFFHNAGALVARGTGPYYYVPKLESHLEARLWNDVFTFAQDRLGVPRATIRATVLIETILAAFETDRSEEHTSELQSRRHLVYRLLL